MHKNIKKRQSGFTIIEVLIVLAIAGLIMLIIFLAVPALQRNSRNTAVKESASAFAAGFQEYISNNDGTKPTAISYTAPKITIGASGKVQAEAKVTGSIAVTTAESTATPSSYTPGTLYWRTGVRCDNTASTRAISVYYYTEVAGTGSATPSCIDAT